MLLAEGIEILKNYVEDIPYQEERVFWNFNLSGNFILYECDKGLSFMGRVNPLSTASDSPDYSFFERDIGMEALDCFQTETSRLFDNGDNSKAWFNGGREGGEQEDNGNIWIDVGGLDIEKYHLEVRRIEDYLANGGECFGCRSE